MVNMSRDMDAETCQETVNVREAEESEPSGAYAGASVPWQYGWRLHIVLFTLFLGLFMSTLETTIIATALVSISSQLGDFQKSNWIPVAYLITYAGFLIIFARLSDIYGRKRMLIFSATLFMVFSAACGAAQDMIQLIVLRAMQGIGGSSIYGCVMGTLREVSPPKTYGRVTGILGIVFALSSVIGPLLGGAIVAHTTWRWVFLLNVPACLLMIILLICFFPSNMRQENLTAHSLRKLDCIGVIFLFAGSTVLIYALESASLSQLWSSPGIIVCLVLSVCCWIIFGLWEIFLTQKKSHPFLGAIIPIFPVRLARHRVVAAIMLAGFFNGFAFFVVLVNLPQRFQIVNGLTPTKAGVNLIPLLIASAFGAGATGSLCARYAWDWYVMLAACSLQVVSLGLLSTLSTTSAKVPGAEFGYETMLGLGFGTFNTCLILISRSVVGGKDQAVTIGAITQTRTLGGVMGLAISQVVLFDRLLSALKGRITENDLRSFFQSANALDGLSPAKAAHITAEYAAGFNLQIRTAMYFVMAAFVASCFAWRRDMMTFDQANAERLKQKPTSDLETKEVSEKGKDMLERV